jgi:hypothetical protein
MVMFYSVTCSFKYSTLTNNFAFLLGWCISIENQLNEAISRTKHRIVDDRRTYLQLQVEFNTILYFNLISWLDGIETSQDIYLGYREQEELLKMLSGL